jgi:FkbM family methyltransferase
VLDVGASVGTVIDAVRDVREGAADGSRPARGAVEGLRHHRALSGVERLVRPVHAAVWDWTGRFDPRRLRAGDRPSGWNAERGDERVSTVIIDDFCADQRAAPWLIEVDVAGWELQALRGARGVQGLDARALRPFVAPWSLEGECVRPARAR